MIACPSCGTENPEGQKFCGECAAPLGLPARAIPEERKVITSLFCDLIGFTAASESADPEDVDAMLSAYSAMARARIESHGGVMEKFIGDAVVGIFGVPAAHEDVPERAVRAALRIVEDADELEAIGGARSRDLRSTRRRASTRGDRRAHRGSDHPNLLEGLALGARYDRKTAGTSPNRPSAAESRSMTQCQRKQ